MKTCPVCGAKGTLSKNTKPYVANYVNSHVLKQLEYYTCDCCDAELPMEFKEKNELTIKDAFEKARQNSVSETLTNLEKNVSFVEIERSFSLPPKTLSKWKTKAKSPSAASAALVSLLGVFPWLSYIGMVAYDPLQSYKIAGAALVKELSKNPDNYPFVLSDENYSIVGICHNKQVNYTDGLVSASCFGGNYVN